MADLEHASTLFADPLQCATISHAATPPVVSTSAAAKAERRGAGGPHGILVTGVLWWASTVSDFLRR